LESLLQSLAQDNPGLCIITTREHLANIASFATQEEKKLDKLMLEAAISLLRHLQLLGTDEEMETMWEALDGHALSILQLGRLLARAYGKDLRKWREIGFTKADKLKQGRSTIRVMEHYEGWLKSGCREHQIELAVLRLMGLFDRPMSAELFRALREPPAIAGLTDILQGLEDFELEAAVTTLIENDMLTHGCDDTANAQSHLSQPFDAHPLIREYFAIQLKEKGGETHKAAHSRLFDYLCKNTPHRPDTLEGLQPLYQAVVHGCQAERPQETLMGVYVERILRGTGDDGFFSSNQLGAIGADLAAVAGFFEVPWSRLSANLTEAAQAWLLNEAAFRLRGLGRLTEALEPMRAGLEMRIFQKKWKNASIAACNLSGLEVMLGRLADAVTDGRRSIELAGQSDDVFRMMAGLTTAAHALFQSGQWDEARRLVVEAEQRLREDQPVHQFLYSVWGFRYCDQLLMPPERAAWRTLLAQTADVASEALTEVEQRAHNALDVVLKGSRNLLDIALNHLTLARVGMYRAILPTTYDHPATEIAFAVNGLRQAGQVHFLPLGLLIAALYHHVTGDPVESERYLREAQQIAERGPMPLYLADVHLHRARLFRDRAELTKAAKLIREVGYGRRYEELADAEEVAKGW
jgi:tetratricopeptide (TPR) repeat protein